MEARAHGPVSHWSTWVGVTTPPLNTMAQGGCWWDYILSVKNEKKKEKKEKEKKEKNKKKGGKKGIESEIR